MEDVLVDDGRGVELILIALSRLDLSQPAQKQGPTPPSLKKRFQDVRLGASA